MSQFGIKRFIGTSAGILSCALTTNMASAQSSNTDDLFTLEEIVVTASKRETNLQDVSISVSAFSGEMIEDMGFNNVNDIFAQTPNVKISGASFTGKLTIRGNSTLNDSLAGEGNVALYFDEVYRPTAHYNGSQLLDVERIEVLRGPQGTLFGRNSTSGLVHNISRKPTADFEGYLTAEVGKYDTQKFEGALSGELTEGVRGRIAASFYENDGFQDNIGPTGGKFGVIDQWAARAHLEFDVTEDVTVLLTYDKSNEDDVLRGFNLWGFLDTVTFEQCSVDRVRSGLCTNFSGVQSTGTSTVIATDQDVDAGDARSTLETDLVIVKATWDINDNLELISISALDKQERYFNPDEDASVGGVLGGFFQFNDHYGSDTEQFTQEFRISGENNGIQWVSGLYYYDDERETFTSVDDLQTRVPDTEAFIDAQSWAVFGQVDYPIGETWSLIVGARYTDDEKEVVGITGDHSTPFDLTDEVSSTREVSNTEFDYKVTLQWSEDDHLVYGSVASGFRSGNFNTEFLLGDIDALTPVDSEEVISFELGFKTTTWAGRARINGAVFYTDVTDKQGIVYTGEDSPSGVLLNVGDAEIYGAELEVNLALTQNLELILGAGYLGSEVNADPSNGYRSSFGQGANAGLGDYYTLDGSELPAPEWSFNTVIRYHIDMAEVGTLTLQLDASYEDETTGLGDNPFVYTEDHTMVNARMLWESADGRWEAQAYVNNATEEKYISAMTTVAPGFDYLLGNYNDPLWWGVKLGVNF